jgi:hypothetical protein
MGLSLLIKNRTTFMANQHGAAERLPMFLLKQRFLVVAVAVATNLMRGSPFSMPCARNDCQHDLGLCIHDTCPL